MADRDPKHLQPGMAEKVRLWLNDCKAEHIELFIVETWRDPKRSDELFEQGRRFVNGAWIIIDKSKVVSNARGGQSLHNYGEAIDVTPKKGNGPDWGFDPHGKIWRRVVEIAKGRGLSWGGDFPSGKGKMGGDYPHFQDAEITNGWHECKARWPGGWKPATKGTP